MREMTNKKFTTFFSKQIFTVYDRVTRVYSAYKSRNLPACLFFIFKIYISTQEKQKRTEQCMHCIVNYYIITLKNMKPAFVDQHKNVQKQLQNKLLNSTYIMKSYLIHNLESQIL